MLLLSEASVTDFTVQQLLVLTLRRLLDLTLLQFVTATPDQWYSMLFCYNTHRERQDCTGRSSTVQNRVMQYQYYDRCCEASKAWRENWCRGEVMTLFPAGLDSSNAARVVDILAGLASAGVTVIITIHQPRPDVFNLMQRVMILSGDGRLVYSGDLTGFSAA